MRGLVITNKGMEAIAEEEVKSLLKAKTKASPTAVSFEIKALIDLCKLCYRGQTFNRVFYLFFDFEFEDDFWEQMEKNFKKLDLHQFVDPPSTFASRCIRVNTNISSQEVEAKVGELILHVVEEKQGFIPKVDLKNPIVTFVTCLVDNHCYFGIDFAGFDLSKRPYRIFQHPQSLKSTIAAGLVRFGNVVFSDSLLDPFCGSGTIPIEASMAMLKYSPFFFAKDKFAFRKFYVFEAFDWDLFFQQEDADFRSIVEPHIYGSDKEMKCLSYSKKNAKIAGVEKNISFTKIDVEWLDTKFQEGEITKIITNPPFITKNADEKIVRKIYDEFFHQADFVLDKKGRIIMVARSFDLLVECASIHGFIVEKSTTIYSGDEELKFVSFKKKI